MEITIKASKTRTVSSRELSRRTADLLDEIDEEGSGIVVVRFGRAAAMLVPLESRRRRAPRRVAIEQREEEPFVMPELDELMRTVFLEIAHCAPERYSADRWVGDVSELLRAFTRLELAGLIEGHPGGGSRWLTEKGELAAAKLNA